jgi:carbonic anhydrase
MLNLNETIVSADEALKKLMDGNKRFANFERRAPILNPEERKALIDRQCPCAVVITCSDSRVCPEIIFDCGLGEIFVVRVASGALGNNLLGSIEYAVLALGVELVVMMGHDNCGVVKAIINEKTALSENIDKLCGHVSRHLTKEQKANLGTCEAAKHIVREDVKLLSEIPELKVKIAEKKLKIVGAHYNFYTNEVELL